MPHSIKDEEGSMLEPIAICGMACRLPGGVDSASSFWDLLKDRRHGQTPKVPKSRFNIDAHFHENADRPGSFNILGGYFLHGDPVDFDPSAFNMTPIEARWLDPQQRKMLEVSYECLESAGLRLDQVAGSNTAVFVGSFTSDYQQMSIRDPDFRHNYAATGVDPGIISNRIGNIFNLNGPSFTINTACSSSVYAIHNACHALRARDCDAAIAGGVNLIMTVDQHMNTAKLGILSPTSFCHTFDAQADGYGRAEGAGALYLKRMSDAIRDGDPIRAVIRSTAVNTNGKVDGMGITHPSVKGQERVVRQAYKRAGLNMDRTAYAELHGTGTPVGDPIEVRAVANALNDTRAKDAPILMGAVKPNIGHSEAASGIFAIMKAALMTETGIIPGVAGFQNLNPNIKEEEWNVKVNHTTAPWPADFAERRASVSSFGYGGTNGHAIIEGVESLYPQYKHATKRDPKEIREFSSRSRLICVSAHDKTTLERNLEVLRPVAEDYHVDDLAYTLNVHRTRHNERTFAIANQDDLTSSLQKEALTYGAHLNAKTQAAPDVALVFTGQGAQWAGMARLELQRFPAMRVTMERLDDVLSKVSPRPAFSLTDLFLNKDTVHDINGPEIAQPICTAVQIALTDLLASWGVKPTVTVGHSSGEIGAAYAAGLISAPEAIVFSYCRGRAVIDGSMPGSMLAVGLGAEEVQPYLQRQSMIYIACENSASSVTLSGDADAVANIQQVFEKQKIFARELKTGRAYHSPMMQPVGDEYERLLERNIKVFTPADLKWRHPVATMISSVTGEILKPEQVSNNPKYWCDNLRNRVLFNSAVSVLTNDARFSSIKLAVEVGPHSALAGPFKQICIANKVSRFTYLPSLLRKSDDEARLLRLAGSLWLTGANVDLAAVNNDVGSLAGNGARSILVDLPPYQWNYEKRFWAEPRASAEQRSLKFPRHDILGGKVSGLSTLAGVWRNVLRHRDLPWMKDHSLGNVAIFPGAGHMSLAVEALRQSLDQDVKINSVTLRDIDIKTALVIPDTDDGVEVQVRTFRNKASTWYSFVVESLSEGVWTVNCEGLISANVTHSPAEDSPVQQAEMLQKVGGRRWYEAFHRVGFQYGPKFQQLQQVRTNRKLQHAAGTVNVLQQSFDGESRYILHPSTVDACLQLIIISIHHGGHKTIPWGVVPLRMDEVTFWMPDAEDLAAPGEAVAWTDRSTGRHFNTHTKLQIASGKTLMEIRNLDCISYEAALPPSSGVEEGPRQPYAEPRWAPDLFKMRSEDFHRCWPRINDYSSFSALILTLLHHKQPVSNVAFYGEAHSSTLSELTKALPATSKLQVHHKGQVNGSNDGRVSFHQVEAEDAEAAAEAVVFDLVVVDQRVTPPVDTKVSSQLAQNGVALAVSQGADNWSKTSILSKDDMLERVFNIGLPVSHFGDPESSIIVYQKAESVPGDASDSGSSSVSLVNTGSSWSSLANTGFSSPAIASSSATTPVLVKLAKTNISKVEWALERSDLNLTPRQWSEIRTSDGGPLIVDLSDFDLNSINPDSYATLKELLLSNRQTLAITTGVKEGKSPNSSMFEGLLRVVRSENAGCQVVLLDIDQHEPEKFILTAVKSLLGSISTKDSGLDTEYWLRGGVLHVCRLIPFAELNHKHFGSSDVEVGRLPSNVPLSFEKQNDELVFEYPTEELSSSSLAQDAVRLQVLSFTGTTESSSPQFVVGTVIESGRLLDRSGLIGKKVIAVIPKVSKTVVDTAVFQPIGSHQNAEKLLLMFRAASGAVQTLLNSTKIEAGKKLLLISDDIERLSLWVQLAKFSQWDFRVVPQGAKLQPWELQQKLQISAHLIHDSSRTSSVSQLVASYKPQFIVADGFSEITREAWRNIPSHSKLLLQDITDIPEIDASPFVRGASVIVSKTDDIFRSAGQDAKDLLAKTSRILQDNRDLQQAVFERVAKVPADGKAALVTSLNYQGSDVKIKSRRQAFGLSSDATYLLVGCLGGLGRSLTTWMRENGAQHFAFISRSGADKPEAASVVRQLQASGASVEVHRADAGDARDVQRIVQQSQRARPIKGVVHAAMVLKDSIFDNMSFDQFATGIAPKVQGTNSLEAALSNADLDFFVYTSSISAVLGNPGQGNYAAANSYLDYSAWRRNLNGKAASSIALPMVLDIGVVSENEAIEVALTRKGMYGIDEQEMLKAFEVAMSQPLPGATKRFGDAQIVLGMEPAELARAVAKSDGGDIYWLQDVRFSHIRQDMERRLAAGGNSSAGGQDDFVASVKKLDFATALPAITEHVQKKASSILMVPVETMDSDVSSVASYGLDSMIGAEMRTWLFKQFGLDIPFQTLLAPSLTFTKLAEAISAQIGIKAA